MKQALKIPSLSGAEWQVMQVVWEEHPLAANEVVGRLEAKAWHPRTVKTLLGRLVRKGALTFKQEGKRYLYSPGVARDCCVREATRSFLQRGFGGAAAPALVHFVEQADLKPKEIEHLKALLDRKKGTSP